MSSEATVPLAGIDGRLRNRRSPLGVLRSWFRTSPVGFVSGAMILFFAVIALLAPMIAPYDPNVSDPEALLTGPTMSHWFGTDSIGRDQLSRVMYGTRVSIGVGFAAVAVGTTLATVIGLASGYLGGKFDLVVQRVVDAFMAFPGLVLVLLVMAIFGTGTSTVIGAIAIFLAFGPSRVVRSAVLAERNKDYVLAARAIGATHLRMAVRHVLVNVAPLVIIIASIAVATAILLEASLAFLGLGLPPTSVSWGRMIGIEARPFFFVAPWLALFPGLALTLTVWSFNMLGDALRDVLDPRLKGSR
jgi:peptide/nickel transport system permease protein